MNFTLISNYRWVTGINKEDLNYLKVKQVYENFISTSDNQGVSKEDESQYLHSH